MSSLQPGLSTTEKKGGRRRETSKKKNWKKQTACRENLNVERDGEGVENLTAAIE